MKKLKNVWFFICRHKYLMTCLVFLLIIGVFDDNSLIHRFENRRQIRELNKEIDYYRQRYEEDTKSLQQLSANPKEELEKVARERYLMKRANEDIFIFEEDLTDEYDER